MMNISKIERLIDAGQWLDLIEALVANGRPMPLSLRLRLGEPDSVVMSALGLSLQRIVELTYTLGPEALETAARLCDHFFTVAGAGPARPCGAAVAIAAASLTDLARQADECGRGLASPLADRIESSLRASAWLLAESLPAQAAGAATGGRAGGAAGRADRDETALDAAVLLWQTADRPTLRAMLEGAVSLAAIEHDVRRLGWWKRSDCAAVLALTTVNTTRPARQAHTLWATSKAA